MVSTLVRALSHIVHHLLNQLRLFWYNISCFAYFRPLPLSTTLYGRLRLLHRPCRLSIGKSCRLGDDVYLATSLHSIITIESNVTINLGSVLVAMESITIGANTAIAEYVSIRDQEHRHTPATGVRGQGYKTSPVRIGKNVWIGRNAYIGPGSTIGDGCIIGANSVVHGEFPPNVLIAGAPAVVKRSLDKGAGA